MNAGRQIKQFWVALVLAFSMLASACLGAPGTLESAVNPANQHTYYLLESSTWTDAEAQAVLLGGHLATINDQAENDWIISWWGNVNLWIGLSDAASEGTFAWANGEPVTYTRWRSGEPNNGGVAGGNEDYVYIHALGFSESPGQWNDFQNLSAVPGQTDIYGVVEVPCVCPPNIVTNAAQGQCGTAVSFSLDSCPGTTPRCQPPSQSQFPIGTTIVTCTALEAGNMNRCSFAVTVNASPAGPVVLLGIDAEDGGPGGHGPLATWQGLANNVYSQARNGAGILVLGGGKNTNDFVTRFWNAIGTGLLQTITFVNSNQLATQSLAGFRLLAVVSDFRNVISGGLTPVENNILRDRTADIANFVNAGGGLLGFCSQYLDPPPAAGPYAYMAGLGGVTLVSTDYTNIDATAEGTILGVNDSLDVNRWHQYFLTYPAFLRPLAYVQGTRNPAAIGGSQVNILLTCPNPVTVSCATSVTLTTRVYNAQCRLLTVIWSIDGAAVRTNTVPANTLNASLSMTTTYGPGLHFVRVTVHDGESSQSCETTVIADTLPSISCPPGDVTFNTEPGQCSAIATFDVTMSSQCSGAGVSNITCSPPSGSRFPKGTTTVLCSASGATGNVTSCSFPVNVVDRETPTIICPPDFATDTAPGQCTQRVFFSATATDNCPGAVVICNPPSGSSFLTGTTTVNCTARDTSQNTTNCTFAITVTDLELPLINCPGDIATNPPPGECVAVVHFAASASDNCPGGVTLTCDPPSGSSFSNRITLVTCSGTDTAGNRADCSFTVTLDGDMTTAGMTDVTVCSGELATFSTLAFGDGPFVFAWTLDGNAIGTNGPTLTIATADLTPGNHIVAVTVRATCGLTTESAILTVGSPVTAGNLTNVTRCVCESVIFNPGISGSEAARFVWKANGQVLEGQTNSTLLLPSLKETDAGIYSVEVHGLCNTVTNSARLTLEGSSTNPLLVTNPAPIAISDFPAVASPYPSVIPVKCVPGILTSLTVTINGISHAYPDDVDILLVNPQGQAIKLMSDAGGGAPLANLRVDFDDAASRVLFNESQLTNGVFRPTDYNEDGLDAFPAPAPGGLYATNLAQLTGLGPNGNWSLYVLDDSLADAGGIARGWSMKLAWEAAPLQISSMGFSSNGDFEIRISGVAGRTHIVEISSDLESWTAIATNTVSENISIFIDPHSSDSPHRFYRVSACP